MTSYIVLVCDKPKLVLRLAEVYFIVQASDVRWDREGEIRKLPLYKINDALQGAEHREKAEIEIDWDDLEPLPEQRLPVSLNPRPTRS